MRTSGKRRDVSVDDLVGSILAAIDAGVLRYEGEVVTRARLAATLERAHELGLWEQPPEIWRNALAEFLSPLDAAALMLLLQTPGFRTALLNALAH
jgi:hypothetical protein